MFKDLEFKILKKLGKAIIELFLFFVFIGVPIEFLNKTLVKLLEKILNRIIYISLNDNKKAR